MATYHESFAADQYGAPDYVFDDNYLFVRRKSARLRLHVLGGTDYDSAGVYEASAIIELKPLTCKALQLLTGFETNIDGAGTVEWTISTNGGDSYWYWDGSGWAEQATPVEFNDDLTLADHLSALPIDPARIIRLAAKLSRSGALTPILKEVAVHFEIEYYNFEEDFRRSIKTWLEDNLLIYGKERLLLAATDNRIELRSMFAGDSGQVTQIDKALHDDESVYAGYVLEGAIATVAAVPTVAGSGYVVNDILNVSEGTGGKVKVLTVNGTGGVLTLQLNAAGTARYAVGTGKTTSGGTGASCTISITAITPVGEKVVRFTETIPAGDEVEIWLRATAPVVLTSDAEIRESMLPVVSVLVEASEDDKKISRAGGTRQEPNFEAHRVVQRLCPREVAWTITVDCIAAYDLASLGLLDAVLRVFSGKEKMRLIQTGEVLRVVQLDRVTAREQSMTGLFTKSVEARLSGKVWDVDPLGSDQIVDTVEVMVI